MSSLVISVADVQKVERHANSDNLDLVQVLGWQLVVRREQYRVGDRVVYIPPDTVLPVEFSDKIGVTKYLSKGRIRCARLRGEPSFGLAIEPEQDWPIGEDVTQYFVEKYGIKKYDPPIVARAEDAEVADPLFISYTEIENLRNFPGVLTPGEQVYVSEKLHGTNSRIGIVEGEWMAGSHRSRRKKPEDMSTITGSDTRSVGLYWFPYTLEAVRNVVEHLSQTYRQVILFGEIFGKVQYLTYGLPGSLGWRMFDVFCDGRYLDYAVKKQLAEQFSLPMVPVLWEGAYSLEQIKALSTGGTTMPGAEHIREGVVVTPIVERIHPKIGRVILKYINDDYLFDKGRDKHDVTDV